MQLVKMPHNPKISLITVSYNSEAFIEENIASVNNQDYDNIEQIFIDGLSTDRTVSIIRENVSSSYRLVSEQDNGIYHAMNKGLKLATGDYIFFLNSDDILADSSVISKYVEAIRKFNPGIIFSDITFTHQNDRNRVTRRWKAGPFQENKLKYGWMPPHPGVAVKQSIFEKYGGFDEQFAISGDYEFLLRVFKNFDGFVCYLNEVSVLMRQGGASNNGLRSAIKKWKEDWLALRKNDIGSSLTVLSKRLYKVNQLF